MRKSLLAGGAIALATAGIATGAVSLASASGQSPAITHGQVLHLISPIKGKITNPTEDLTEFIGPLTDQNGLKVGTLQGYCVTIEDKTGTVECTTTLFLGSSQITLVGPSYDRKYKAQFLNAVDGGTGRFQNVRGQAHVTLEANQDVHYDINLLP